MDRNTVMHNGLVLTLFDPMTHTPARYVTFDRLLVVGMLITDFLYSQSGLGDHGLEGFEDFLKCHKCTPICSSMEFVSFQSWLTQFKVLENSKLTQMHRKHHYPWACYNDIN